jgi:mannose/cellobiose epimerase-like protein (N-acyl-D-glucosamine 2-epimerase family)
MERLRSVLGRLASMPRQPTVRTNPHRRYHPTAADLSWSRQVLVRILTENILPFWYPSTIDMEHGGYRASHDIRGHWMGPANKSIVNQARLVWFYSRLARSPYGDSRHLKAAAHGYQFLHDRMWDHKFGGFFWEVDSTGSTAAIPHKHLYGQAFALYALSEYAATSEDGSALSFARRTFKVLDERAHDAAHGGYREFLRRDWSIASESSANCLGRHIDSETKTANTHLHLMEAVTRYFVVTKDSLAGQRLIELISIVSSAILRKTIGACTDQHLPDWTPLRGPQYDRVSYGHNLESIWLSAEACEAVGLPIAPMLDLYETLFAYALRYGYDRRAGGFFEEGPLEARADRRAKSWWVQAESLLCALYMYRLTGREIYFGCFLRTLEWIVNRQVDWQDGEWFERIQNDGAEGNKAGAWKDPYHNGRAMMECLSLLDSIAELCLTQSPASR